VKAHAIFREEVGVGNRIWAQYWTCSNCSQKIDKNDRFCRNCGAEMLSSDVPTGGGRARS